MRVVEKTARTVDDAVAEALAALGATRDEVEVEVLEEGNKGLFGLLGARQARVRVWLKERAPEPAAAVPAQPERAGGEAGPKASRGAKRTGWSGAGDNDDENRIGGRAAELGGDLDGGLEEDEEEERTGPAGPPDERRVARARAFLTGVLERMEVDAALETSIAEDGTVQINIVGQDLGLIIGRRGQTLDALQFLVNQVANRGEGRRVRIVLDVEGYRARRVEALTALARRMAARARRQRRKVALEPMSAHERRIVHLALASEHGVETYSEGEEPYRRVIIAPREL
ncbi:MAG TPA: RNA-binding cell elongation regulator Jag/EloR [Limnochordales bacterium]